MNLIHIHDFIFPVDCKNRNFCKILLILLNQKNYLSKYKILSFPNKILTNYLSYLNKINLEKLLSNIIFENIYFTSISKQYEIKIKDNDKIKYKKTQGSTLIFLDFLINKPRIK